MVRIVHLTGRTYVPGTDKGASPLVIAVASQQGEKHPFLV